MHIETAPEFWNSMITIMLKMCAATSKRAVKRQSEECSSRLVQLDQVCNGAVCVR